MLPRALILTAALMLYGMPCLCVGAAPKSTQQNSKDFRAAWEQNRSLLAKSVIYAGSSPTLTWNPALNKLVVSVEVLDVLESRIVLKKDGMKNGGILRDGSKALAAGFYKITYTANIESAHEYFIMGPPKTIFENLKLELAKINTITGESRLNIGAQLRRGEILFARENYDVDGKTWQEKAIYTLASLASMSNMLKEGQQSVSKDVPGLHIRARFSKIDQSLQHYRLFVPTTYNPTQGIPLLLVLAPPFAEKQKPFIESVFMESHRDAVQLSRFAQRHGVAVLWSGYRNVQEGWTCESTHVAEAIDAVENDYNIDKARISVYGTCGSGYLAGRLVSTYPRRFAGVVYDKAILERNLSLWRNSPEPVFSWYEAINPAGRVIDNRHIGIFVFNDNTKTPGRGEIELSEKFMANALKTRTDVKAYLSRKPLGHPAWDMFFEWLATCRNKDYSPGRSDFLKESGYEGPIAEVFSTPFMVVRGTTLGTARADIDSVIEHIKNTYRRQFFDATPVVKNDHEVSEQEMRDYSLILVGSPVSNAIWKKLEAHLSLKATSSGLFIKDRLFALNSAFLAVFEHPMNAQRHIITLGSYDPNSIGLTRSANLGRAEYDCRIFEPVGNSHRTHTISKYRTNKTDNPF